MSDRGNATARSGELTPSVDDAAHSSSLDILLSAVSDPLLTEGSALNLLKRNDLPALVLEKLSKNPVVTKLRKLKLALVEHPRMPRHLSLPIIRHLFTFDLMQLALKPTVAADIKAAADEALVKRLEAISTGERLTLARRASGSVAGALLLDSEPRVIKIALENSRLTEALVVKALLRPVTPPALAEAVCHHHGWSVRPEVRIALLRGEHTPVTSALEFARTLPANTVREVLHGSRLPESVKECVLKEVEERKASSG